MKFTPAQAIDLVGLTPETLRYWKKYLTPIADRKGHAPCYNRGDLLALIVVRRVTRDFKMDVSALESSSKALFLVCSQSSQWPRLGLQWVVLTANGAVSVHKVLPTASITEPAIIFPIEVAMRELDEKLTVQDAAPQLELSLPLVSVGQLSRSQG